MAEEEAAAAPSVPVDLSKIGGVTESGQPRVGPVETKPYDPTRDRENIRGQIALWLVWTLVGLIAATFLFAAGTVLTCGSASCNNQTKDLEAVKVVVQLLLTPLVGLVGAVAGFYFGEKSGKTG